MSRVHPPSSVFSASGPAEGRGLTGGDWFEPGGDPAYVREPSPGQHLDPPLLHSRHGGFQRSLGVLSLSLSRLHDPQQRILPPGRCVVVPMIRCVAASGEGHRELVSLDVHGRDERRERARV